MSEPPFVPAKVPAPSRRRELRSAARPPRYLTGDPSGWRFQMRLSTQFLRGGQADFRLAGGSPIVRAQIGPRSRSDAKAMAQQLAALCQTICAAAADIRNEPSMSMQPLDNNEAALVRQVVNACENAIKEAVALPSRAIGLAKGFGAALTSLQLIQSEVAKGGNGAVAITANADALTRAALTDVLNLSAQPKEAFAALAAVEDVGPPAQFVRNTPAPAAGPVAATHGLPLFSAISQAYIDMRNDRDRNHPDIPMLILRRQLFLDVIGDRTPDRYYPSDLQTFVNRMQYWPANVTKRSDMRGRSTLEILEANKNFELQPMAENTMMKGYVANIRTMMRHRIQDLNYRDPFAGAKLSLPQAYKAPKPREGVSIEVTNRVFGSGVSIGAQI